MALLWCHISYSTFYLYSRAPEINGAHNAQAGVIFTRFFLEHL